MPTGITSNLYAGKPETFENFMLKCARQMGALMHMRDDSYDAPIRHREPSDYHAKALVKAKEELAKWESMTVAQAILRLEENQKEDIERYQREIQKRKEMLERYNDMLLKVEAWQPPTPEHEGLKQLAIDQLKQSISHDCDVSYYERSVKEKQDIDAYKYLADMVNAARESVAYHTAKAATENSHVDEANKWIDDLLNSIDSASAESKTY